MNYEELNRRYGAPGRIVFREDPQGIPVAALANQYGSAEISLFGAQVLSYRPTGSMQVLFTPQNISFGPDKADHGGIPNGTSPAFVVFSPRLSFIDTETFSWSRKS